MYGITQYSGTLFQSCWSTHAAKKITGTKVNRKEHLNRRGRDQDKALIVEPQNTKTTPFKTQPLQLPPFSDVPLACHHETKAD